MHPFQKYLPEHWNQWVEKYALMNSDGKYKTLGSADFSNELKLHFADDSFANFHGAFAVKNSDLEEIAIFTEHCGYHVFNLHGIEKLEGSCIEGSVVNDYISL